MTANASRDVLYFASGAIVLVRAYQLTRMDWSRPLKQGPGFFLAFEVPPGFYEGSGARWLTRFRAVLFGEAAVEWISLAAMVTFGWWRWLPVWAGGSAVLYVSSLSLFGLVAARHLGSAQAQPAVALSFETRRIRDYLSPLAETLMAALLVAGWYVLVIWGDANVLWATPVVATYVVMALLVAKIMMIRAGTPLPPHRTEEHHRYFEAFRRYGLSVIDAARWFFAFLLAGYAVLHGGRDSTTSGLQWSLVAVAFAIWLGLVVTIVRGAQRLDVMGRSLRPLGSWAGPFRPSPWISRGSGVWAVSFVIGLVALFAAFGF